MNWIRLGMPVYVHLSVADVHVSNVAGRLDHVKFGTGVGRGKSELVTVGGRMDPGRVKVEGRMDTGRVKVEGRMDPGRVTDMVLVPVLDERVAVDDSIRGYGRRE